MKQVLVISPSLGDGCFFYRSLPFAHLEMRKDIQVSIRNGMPDEAQIAASNIVFYQRPYDPNHLAICIAVKKYNRPLWLDFDDDFFSVPTDNPSFEYYGDPQSQKVMAEIISLADVITVTTKALKHRFSCFKK